VSAEDWALACAAWEARLAADPVAARRFAELSGPSPPRRPRGSAGRPGSVSPMSDQGTEEIDDEGLDDVDGSESEPGWFGVRCIFHWSEPPTYEERITLWHADSLDDAIEQAEAEAYRYAEALHSEYLQLAQAYWIGPTQPAHGAESSRCCATAPSSPTTTSTPSTTPARSASGPPSRACPPERRPAGLRDRAAPGDDHHAAARRLAHVVAVGFTYQPEADLARVITSRRATKVANLVAAGGRGRVALCQVDGRRWLTLEGWGRVEDGPEQVADAEARYASRYQAPRPNPDRVVLVVAVDRCSAGPDPPLGASAGALVEGVDQEPQPGVVQPVEAEGTRGSSRKSSLERSGAGGWRCGWHPRSRCRRSAG